MRPDTKNHLKVALWGGVAVALLISAILAAFE
jgi:hypothetical protein